MSEVSVHIERADEEVSLRVAATRAPKPKAVVVAAVAASSAISSSSSDDESSGIDDAVDLDGESSSGSDMENPFAQ